MLLNAFDFIIFRSLLFFIDVSMLYHEYPYLDAHKHFIDYLLKDCF